MEPKIENGIPIPGGTSGVRTGISALLRRLKSGESVFVKLNHGSAQNSAQHALGAGNYACRKENGGYRIWRK